jgi:hypothetical protein
MSSPMQPSFVQLRKILHPKEFCLDVVTSFPGQSGEGVRDKRLKC